MTYRTRYIIAFAVAIISGLALVKTTFGDLGSGNIAAWPWALLSFVVFAVSTPLVAYYRSRRETTSLAEKEQTALEIATLEEVDNGKK